MATLGGFIRFIRNVMKIPVGELPDNSDVIGIAYNVAITLTNDTLQCIPNPNPAYPSIYDLAVYNLGGDRIINYAPDAIGSTYFTDLRAKFNLDTFVGGVVNSTNDNGSGVSLTVPDAMSGLTFQDLQTLKTPYGRTYLGLIQAAGPTIWGIT